MRILQAIALSWHFVRSYKRIIFTYYGIQLSFALIVILPVYLAVTRHLGHSLAGAQLVGSLDFELITNLILNEMQVFQAVLPVLAGVFVIFSLVHLFLSGGILAVYISDTKRYVPSYFWGHCGHHFWPLFRLWMIFLPLYSGAVLVLLPLMRKLPRVLFASGMAEGVHFWLDNGILLLFFFLFLLLPLIFDFSRIYLVISAERKAWKGFYYGCRLVLRNFRRSYGLYLYLFLIAVLLHLIYAFVADLLSRPIASLLILMVMAQQLFILAKIMLRLTYFGSEISLYPSMYTKIHPEMREQPAAQSKEQIKQEKLP
ncbi:MAG: hypothetical protein D6814_10495 [Calditrichaeota bacterium]|nr:MAG: hypothetical protein D6814_10495 [Calditrichota bacterium]